MNLYGHKGDHLKFHVILISNFSFFLTFSWQNRKNNRDFFSLLITKSKLRRLCKTFQHFFQTLKCFKIILTMADSVQFELMKAQIIKLLPELTCYDCGELPNAQCANQEKFKCLNPSESHLLCHDCKEGRDSVEEGCPCGSNLSKIACSLVSSIMDMLPFSCKNRYSGCEEVLFQEEMKAHLSRCMFEYVHCFYCDEYMPFQEFLNDHIDLPPVCSTIPEIENKVEIKLDDDSDDFDWKPSLVQKNPLNKPLFYFVCETGEDIVHAWIYFLGFIEDAKRFTYSLEVNSGRSVKFTGPVKSIFEDHDDIRQERDSFMIGLPIGKKLCKEHGNLVFNVEIFDKKEEVKDDEHDSAMSDDE